MSNTEQATVTTDEKRIPYSIEIDPIDFEGDSEGKYMTSIELCHLAYNIFDAAFADFYGCKFEPINGWSTISLYFKHIDCPEGRTVATEKSGAKQLGNRIIDAQRNRDHLMRDGDRYVLTEDGLDIIKTVIHPSLYNQRNNKLDQKRFVSETTDNEQSIAFGQPNVLHLTKVSSIDARKIAALIWGSRTKDDKPLDYDVKILKDISVGSIVGAPAMPGTNFVLRVEKVYTDQVRKTYEKFCLAPESSIIRHG